MSGCSDSQRTGREQRGKEEMKRYKQDVLWPMFSVSGMNMSGQRFKVGLRVSKECSSVLCPLELMIQASGQKNGES